MNIPSRILAALTLAALGACGQQSGSGEPDLLASSGQVVTKSGALVSRYAAARFAEQATFGPTPELIAELEKKGFSQWIDEQFALPASKIDTSPIRVYNSEIPAEGQRAYEYFISQIYPALISSPDQLRRRVSWSISQFVPTSSNKLTPYPALVYANFLQDQAFGNYGDFIRALTTNPPMGLYLDNIQNRPLSPQCIGCAPNENYARELMQLFTLGVVKLNMDGSTVRDAKGVPVETYSQEDVSQLARALTGWRMAEPPSRWDWSNRDGVLTPDPWELAHDYGEKKVLGTTFPANKGAAAELETIVSLLMAHQNIAPFVSLRMIQHLVTSNPSPAYIGRVAAVFRNNGKGVAGDMKAVVKAILLDAEARKGDQIGADSNSFGKLREPVLWFTGVLRGLGCKQAPRWDNNNDLVHPYQQTPYNPTSVFSFYAPTDRAPGSNLLAPEQKLINADTLSARMGGFNFGSTSAAAAAGCKVEPFGEALAASPLLYVNMVNERFFRGAMAPTLRQNLMDLAPTIWGENNNMKAMNLLAYALSSPYYGVMR
ncbi:DUF1800 family protein [Pseudoduganella sp. FT55W]|uniref:DUF1800 family protein n=1 Tax=Duganella rivi TaxID=2666083 RepID=A0A7X4GSL3_9BURK|nr:DUF1800 domain-containing protein [Duganella rivi]MYM68416.1 DUF1800 family protein [Duganella rivi]